MTMNHLEALTAEWLAYNGYFTRSTVKVGKRPQGGWEGEMDVVGFNPVARHFIHVECSTDAYTWSKREKRFQRKFALGREHAPELFTGITRLPAALDQVVVIGYVSGANKHRNLGGGRLMSSQELTAEILNNIPKNAWGSAVPENFPLLRTLQLSIMAGARVAVPEVRLVPKGP